MQKGKQLYEGKAKKVFETEDTALLIVSYKDDATAFNGLKKGTIVGKGVINNKMSNLLMQRLERWGIPTHFVKELNDGGGLFFEEIRRGGGRPIRLSHHRILI